MVSHDGETKKLQWPPSASSGSAAQADCKLLKKMVIDRFELTAFKAEQINLKVASYSANLSSDDFLDDVLLERIMHNDEAIIEDIVHKSTNLRGSKKPWHIMTLHLDIVVGELSNSESSNSSVQVFERPELEHIHPIVLYHLVSRLKRNKTVNLKDLQEIMALKQVKQLCTHKVVCSLTNHSRLEQLEFCTDAIRETLADLKE